MAQEHRRARGGGSGRRQWQLVVLVGVAVAIAAVVGAVLVVVNHDGSGSTLADPTTISTTTLPPGVGAQSGGPLPPAQGAYVGAYVQPQADYKPAGQIRAVTDFEKETGRELDIVHTYHPWDDPFPDQVDTWALDNDRMLLLSWAGTDTRVIQTGRYDDLIRSRARAIRALGHPVLLQWRWEMDRPNLRASIWSPTDFIAAWRHIRKIFHDEGADNVSWVWCPTSTGFTVGRAAQFYPGDEDVDWVCATVYPTPDSNDFRASAQAFLDWTKGHPGKPAMISEWGSSSVNAGGQSAWVRQAEQVVRSTPAIKALVYFNANDADLGEWALRNTGVTDFRSLLAKPYFNQRRLPAIR